MAKDGNARQVPSQHRRMFAHIRPILSNAQPVEGDLTSGKQIAVTICSSSCHRVQSMLIPERGDSSTSDQDGPSSFQSIANLPSSTGLSLHVFLHSNHKNMPNLILSKAEAGDTIAYILSLKKQ
jgi:mono/diheme cytochrome c family protein